jgi:hypothetical protein
MDGRMECTNYDVDIPGVVADPANIGTPGVDAEQDNTEPDDPGIQVLDEAHDDVADIRGVDGELHLSIIPPRLKQHHQSCSDALLGQQRNPARTSRG